MAGDPTPLEYDDPIVDEEWGVALPSGEAARKLDEGTARLMVKFNPNALLVKRRVTYDPWVVVPKGDTPD